MINLVAYDFEVVRCISAQIEAEIRSGRTESVILIRSGQFDIWQQGCAVNIGRHLFPGVVVRKIQFTAVLRHIEIAFLRADGGNVLR